MKLVQSLSKLLVAALLFTLVFSNAAVVEAATKVAGSISETVLTAENVGNDIYLKQVISLDNEKSHVGIFYNASTYKSFFGTSENLVDWQLKSQYFGLVHGNGIFMGISDSYDNPELKFTKDGQTWSTVKLANKAVPTAVKYEHGYFKLVTSDEDYNRNLLISVDGETWYDVTNDLPAGASISNIIVHDSVFYVLVRTNNGGDGLKVYKANAINESKTEWTEVQSLGKKGYGMVGNFIYDGKTVGVNLYSMANYTDDYYVSDNMYYVTTDFINWEQKDWSVNRTTNYYSMYTSSSTDSKDVTIGGKKVEAIEVHEYEDPSIVITYDEWGYEENSNTYLASKIVLTKDGKTFEPTPINVYVGDVKVSKDIVGEPKIDNVASWARDAAEYALGRDYVGYSVSYDLTRNINREDFLTLIMKALNLQEPAQPVAGYVPFSDIWDTDSLVNRARKLGLTNGKGNNIFDPYAEITRQDMMVLTYNVLNKLGYVGPDSALTALEGYKDKHQVSEYAKLAASSLSKADIIKGDGISIKPKNNVTGQEAVQIAYNLNKYRVR